MNGRAKAMVFFSALCAGSTQAGAFEPPQLVTATDLRLVCEHAETVTLCGMYIAGVYEAVTALNVAASRSAPQCDQPSRTEMRRAVLARLADASTRDNDPAVLVVLDALERDLTCGSNAGR